MSNSGCSTYDTARSVPEATTTTEPVTLPEWEATLRRTGYLASVQDDSVHDPDYLIARLRAALARPAQGVAHLRAEGDRDSVRIADVCELKFIREYVEEVISELRTYTRAGNEMLDALRGACPDINWGRMENGFIGSRSYFPPAGPDAVARCAIQLGLHEGECSGTGRT